MLKRNNKFNDDFLIIETFILSTLPIYNKININYYANQVVITSKETGEIFVLVKKAKKAIIINSFNIKKETTLPNLDDAHNFIIHYIYECLKP